MLSPVLFVLYSLLLILFFIPVSSKIYLMSGGGPLLPWVLWVVYELTLANSIYSSSVSLPEITLSCCLLGYLNAAKAVC